MYWVDGRQSPVHDIISSILTASKLAYHMVLDMKHITAQLMDQLMAQLMDQLMDLYQLTYTGDSNVPTQPLV